MQWPKDEWVVYKSMKLNQVNLGMQPLFVWHSAVSNRGKVLSFNLWLKSLLYLIMNQQNGGGLISAHVHWHYGESSNDFVKNLSEDITHLDF